MQICRSYPTVCSRYSFTEVRSPTRRRDQRPTVPSGTATFGHYWIYIYDFARQLWRKYNDGYVTEVKDEKEIYEQDAHYPATPYYLVYVHADSLDVMVDPVCRELVEESAAAADAPASSPTEGDAAGRTQGREGEGRAQGDVTWDSSRSSPTGLGPVQW